MDVAHISQFISDEQVYEVIDGDKESFGFEAGDGTPLEGTYCQRLVQDEIPSLIPDSANDPRVSSLEVTQTANIGAYLGVPIRLSDGRLYGTLCCLSHTSQPSLTEREVALVRTVAGLVADHIEREELQTKTWKLQLEAAAIHALSAALEARDGYTGEHSAAVLDLCDGVAVGLGLPEEDRFLVRQSALLHDIGKIGVPDSILRKPGALDEDEWVLMKRHPEIGSRIVEMIPGLQRLAPILRADTNGGTAVATPTVSPATRSRSRVGSSGRATPITRWSPIARIGPRWQSRPQSRN